MLEKLDEFVVLHILSGYGVAFIFIHVTSPSFGMYYFYYTSTCNTCRAHYFLVYLPVRLSVHPMPVLCLNEWTHRNFFSDILVGASF